MDALKNLRIKADQYGKIYESLGRALKQNPAGIVFEAQMAESRFRVSEFESDKFDIAEIKTLANDMRKHEKRLQELNELLA